MSKPTLCLDFDGVLHSYSSGWQGADVIPDPPVRGADEFVLAAAEEFNVEVFSSRSNKNGGVEAMMAWCKEHLPKSHQHLVFVYEKPPAMVTLDDRAITFTGEWPSVESLQAFKPWNK